MKQLTILILVLVLTSCGNLKHSNFNRQKFTDLKIKSANVSNENHKETEFIDKIDGLEYIDPINEKKIVKDKLFNSNVQFNEKTNAPVIDVIETFSKNKLSGQEKMTSKLDRIENLKREVKSSKFVLKKIETVEESTIQKFNLLVKIGLMLALMSLLLYTMALFSTSLVMFFFSILSAHAIILCVWIISFMLIGLAKKIPKHERDKQFKLQYGLALFTAIAGPFVGIAVIFLGIIIFFNNFF